MLEIRHICKTFGTKTVASDINLRLANGKLLAILGRSGCGKSTLLNIIAGLQTPDSGEVWLNQTLLNPLAPEQRKIALMFQNYALFPHLNAWQNVAFGLKMQGVGKRERQHIALNYLAQVGLSEAAERLPTKLSGGEQQRVALARALAVQPKALLLDEAFSSLDTGLRQQLRELTLAQIRQLNIPALLVTHDPAEAFLMADEIAVMQNGEIVAHGVPSALKAQPQNRHAAQLLALPNVSEQHYIPEHAIRLAPPNTPPNGDWQSVPIIGKHILPDGSIIRFAHPQFGVLQTHCPPELNAQIGEQVWVHIQNEQIVYFQ